jgi:hypothetical protein
MKTRREETGPVTDSMLDKYDKLKIEHEKVKIEKAKFKRLYLQSQKHVADYEVATGNKVPEPTPELPPE